MTKSKTSNSLIVASIFIIIAGVILAKSVILPFVLAVFISIICMQPIVWLEKKKVPYAIAVFIVLVLVAMVMILLGSIIGKSMTNFMKDVPKYEQNLRQIFTGLIEKPIEPVKLLQRIYRAIESASLQEENTRLRTLLPPSSSRGR